MLRKLLEHKAQILAVLVLVFGLACVRAFEDTLFYDPLLAYYKVDFTAIPLPQMDSLRLSLGLFLRYFLNTVLSLGIIYAIFRNVGLIRFTAVLYVVFFIVLIAVFFAVMTFTDDKMLLFNIRRFIIQPIFLLLFIPAFYFQQRSSGKNNVS